jgi:hypothetical protein
MMAVVLSINVISHLDSYTFRTVEERSRNANPLKSNTVPSKGYYIAVTVQIILQNGSSTSYSLL